MATTRRRVLFVGSFVRETPNGANGGQMFACRTLLDSHLGEQIDWVLIDSTARLPIQHVSIRTAHAIKRMVKLVYHLLFSRIDTVLVFTGHGSSFLEKGLMCLLARLRGTKTIIAPRSGIILEDFKSPWRTRFTRHVFQRVSLVICQSPYWQQVFTDIAPGGHYRVIHNWIDADIYQAGVPEHTGPGTPVVQLLFLGWVTRDKGIFELVNAVLSLRHSHAIHLHVCGNGDAFNDITQLVEQHQAQAVITLHNWVRFNDKLAQLQNADIFLLPTHFEGFPNAMLEAMSSRTAVICSDIPAITSLTENNVHCLHVPVGNEKALASAVARLAESAELRETLAGNASTLVRERFSVNYGITQFGEVL